MSLSTLSRRSVLIGAAVAAFAQTRQLIPFPASAARPVPEDVLRRIYDDAKTPFKYGIILRPEEGKMLDCPAVFRYGTKWYMTYLTMNRVGYETHLAESDNLLDWRPLGKILSFPENGKHDAAWDRWQADGSIALTDTQWGGKGEPMRFQGKYWMSYLGGALQGYETDPLSIGIAWSTRPWQAAEWTRLTGNPVLSAAQPDTREFEKLTLYRSNVIYDAAKSLGFPFVMYYNGKHKNGYERIGMAVSRDMVNWQRYGDVPVVGNGEDKMRGISGDPQVVRMGDVWVMFYFGAGWKPKAFDTFAASYDLVHWTKWDGPNLMEPSEPWDETYAHKPWLVKYNGVVYHFYCAVGKEGRTIAVATSKDMRRK